MFWGGNFNIFGGGDPPQQHWQGVQQPNNTPPTSKRALRNLPTVTVTSDDLIEESNKNCCICLEDQRIGATAVKLACGHIYHPTCLKEWLEKSCMCPICRYELETDDVNYEKDRKARMKKRKLRLRRDELDKKTIAKLKELMSDLGVSFMGCIDKRELVDKLVQSGKIDIVDGVGQMEIPRSEISQKSVGDLKRMLLSFGISAEGALYKSELIDRLIESQRILIVDDGANDSGEGAIDDHNHDRNREDGGKHIEDKSSAHVEMKSNYDNYSGVGVNEFMSSPSACSMEEHNDRIRLSKSFLETLSIPEIKQMMREANVCTLNCLERTDLIDRIASHSTFYVTDD